MIRKNMTGGGKNVNMDYSSSVNRQEPRVSKAEKGNAKQG